jgi:shikimate dehydrogenase
VLLVGAGGAAAGIAFAVARHGVDTLAILNRTAVRAEALAARVRAAYPGLRVAAEAESSGYDLVVNATSLGMRPDDRLPIAPAVLTAGVLAADVITNPERTAFLAEARSRGCTIHGGLAMLRAQVELMSDYILA